MKTQRWHIPMTVVFLCVGLLISLQFQAQSQISNDLSMQRSENLIAMVRGLSEKRQKLALEIVDLRYKLNTQMESDRDEKILISNLTEELDKLSIVTGATKLEGPGLVITIEKYMPILYIDVINIINELWAAGAEAISVNEHRITANTAIFYAEDAHAMSITVNDKMLEYPIVIQAIGNANNLEKGLTIPGGIIDNLALFKAYPILEKIESITVPAVTRPPLYFFLEEYKPPEQPPAVPTETPPPEANNQPL